VAGFRLPDFGTAATSGKLPALKEPAAPHAPAAPAAPAGKMRKASGIGA
jgi:hypothetical protein